MLYDDYGCPMKEDAPYTCLEIMVMICSGLVWFSAIGLILWEIFR